MPLTWVVLRLFVEHVLGEPLIDVSSLSIHPRPGSRAARDPKPSALGRTSTSLKCVCARLATGRNGQHVNAEVHTTLAVHHTDLVRADWSDGPALAAHDAMKRCS